MEGSKRVYQRTLANIRPWPKHLLKHPAGPADDLLDEGGNLIDAQDNTAYYFGRLPIGSIAGIIESEGSKMIHFGRVIKHSGQENVFHMFGTTAGKERQPSHGTVTTGQKCAVPAHFHRHK